VVEGVSILALSGFFIAGPLLLAWVKIRLWDWQANRDRR
jgi:hypothetical protein